MNTQTKTVLKTALFTIAIGGMISVYSCKKDNVSNQKATDSSTPVTHDKPFGINSNTGREVGILIEDANGNLVPLDKTRKKGDAALSTCNDDSYAMKLVYRGYTVYGSCFSGPGGISDLALSWDLYLPEDVNIITDATTIARVKIGPNGFTTSPTGTGFRTLSLSYSYVETVNIDGAGTMMKKWRITSSATPFSETDYCGNIELTPTFRIKTDCIDIPNIQSASMTDYMDVNSLSVPDLWAQDGSTPQGKGIKFVPNIPLCGNGCHGYWKWATNYQLEYKLTSASLWIPFSWFSSDIISFTAPVTSSGTYEFRYRALVRGTSGGTDASWSDWQVSSFSPTVIIP